MGQSTEATDRLIAGILAPLSAGQELILEAVWTMRRVSGGWPLWEHVQEALEDAGYDADNEFGQLPAWNYGSWGRYLGVWHASPSFIPMADTPVALTVLGAAQCRLVTNEHTAAVFRALRYFAARLHDEPSVLSQPRRVAITREELGKEFQRAGFHSPTAWGWRVDWVACILEHEPKHWGAFSRLNKSWTVDVGRDIRRFSKVGSLDEYLRTLCLLLKPSSEELLETQELPEFRAVETLLFTDIVQSTSRTVELGDRAWRDLVEKHHAAVRELIKKHGGKEVDTAGDGFFASFPRPSQAVLCAEAIVESVRRSLDLRVRAGLHAGEVEIVDGKAGGIAVNIASRIAGVAGAEEVLVSQTVRDLMAGSDVSFGDAGLHELRGIPEPRHLYKVLPTKVTGSSARPTRST